MLTKASGVYEIAVGAVLADEGASVVRTLLALCCQYAVLGTEQALASRKIGNALAQRTSSAV